MDSDIIKARIEKTQDIIDKKNALIEKRYKNIEKAYGKVGKFCGMTEDFTATFDFAKRFEKTVKDVWDAHRGEIYARYGDSDNYYDRLTEGVWDEVEDVRDKLCGYGGYVESIENAQKEIAERNRMLGDLNEKLAKALERENIFDIMPQCMKDFMNDAIECWDAWDKMRRESVKNKQREYYDLCDKKRVIAREKGKDSEEYREICKDIRYIEEMYNQFEWHELPRLDDDEIHERNVKAGKALVTDLYDRVTKIVGTFEDASELEVTRGNGGFSVINGFVRGNGKTAKVQSIGAGGYNIQRFHIRTLVHEVH